MIVLRILLFIRKELPVHALSFRCRQGLAKSNKYQLNDVYFLRLQTRGAVHT